MKFLKGIGWLLIPYIMLPFQWRKIGLVSKIGGTVWALFALVIAIGSAAGDQPNSTNGSVATTSSPAEQPKLDAKEKEEADSKTAEEKKKELLNVKAKMDLKVNNDKVIITLNTNVPDGGLYEVAIMDSKLNAQSEFLPVQDGKIIKEFTIPKEWSVGYIGGSASFRFNHDQKPQPDSIKQIYGNKGENLTGDLAKDTPQGGKYASAEVKSIAYPSEEVVRTEQLKIFNTAITEMKKVSKGLIIDIQPRSNNKWDMVNVVVGDAWYHSQKYEQERFADQVGGMVEQLVINAGLGGELVNVYFVDSYGKTVASPKIFGGYEIKE